MPPLRFLFYSHDTLGLGHLRRTLKLADAVLSGGNATCLVVTGTACSALLETRPGLDFVKLPSVRKIGPEAYAARSLDVSTAAIVDLRSSIIQTSVEAFEPHVIVVDNVPRGMLGELEPTLGALPRHRRPRLVLTMRDVLDAGSVIRQLWMRHGIYRLLESAYDELLVFGNPELYDVRIEYDMPPSVAARTRYCGYLGTGPVRSQAAATRLLLTVGGGADGAPLAHAFVAACRLLPEELRAPTAVVLGPEMPAADRATIEAAATALPGMTVHGFVPRLVDHLAAAEAVVCMGGFNTISEVIALRCRALVVPRTQPRAEQLIRAKMFHALGLLDYLEPAEVNPEVLAARLRRLLFSPPPATSERVGLAGLDIASERLRQHAVAVAGESPRACHA